MPTLYVFLSTGYWEFNSYSTFCNTLCHHDVPLTPPFKHVFRYIEIIILLFSPCTKHLILLLPPYLSSNNLSPFMALGLSKTMMNCAEEN